MRATLSQKPDGSLAHLTTAIVEVAHPIGEYTGRERLTASYPSGQRDLTVNQLALPTGVRIPHSPPSRLFLLNTPLLAIAPFDDFGTYKAQKWFGIKRFGAQYASA